METNHWDLKEGFLIGGALAVIGLLLQLGTGPIVWETFAWPVNIMVLAAFISLIVIIHLLRKQLYVFRFLSTLQAAIPSMAIATVLTIVMGLIRQGAGDGWLNNMLTFWPFALMYVYMALIVGLVVLKHAPTLHHGSYSRLSSFLFHLGLFITMTTATLGNADLQELLMSTQTGTVERRAIDEQQHVIEVPIAIELKRFIMETYDDGSPRRFASDIKVTDAAGTETEATVDVNKPLKVDGWKIYQYDYDESKGAASTISVLQLVSDPWLPYVYTGIYMMLAGAALMAVAGVSNRKEKKGTV